MATVTMSQDNLDKLAKPLEIFARVHRRILTELSHRAIWRACDGEYALRQVQEWTKKATEDILNNGKNGSETW